MIGLWAFLSYGRFVDRLLLPFPHEVFALLIKGIVINRGLLRPTFQTMTSLFFSFIIGASTGVLLGMISGYYEKFYYSIEFILDFFRSLPSLLLVPLAIVFFGIDPFSSLVVVSWSVFVYVFINSAYGVRYGRKSYREIGVLMGLGNFQKFFWLVLPSALPHVFSGLRLSFSVGLIVAIGTEMLIGHQGIGGKVIEAYMVYNNQEVFSIIIIVGLIGYLGSKLIEITEKKLIHWRGN